MMEIVFSQGAQGSLRMAKGAPYAVQQEPSLLPVDGRAEDVFSLDLAWSVGDISPGNTREKRRAVLEALYAALPEGDQAQVVQAHLDSVCSARRAVLRRAGQGEALPEHWAGCLSLSQALPPALATGLSLAWRQLQEENAPLRLTWNGRLQSAPEEAYDQFLLQAAEALPEEFLGAELIGTALGRYQLGIHDGWLALRLNALISAGRFVAERADGPDVCRQVLRRGRP